METLSNSEWPTLSQVKEEKACNVSSEENKKCDVCSYATAKMSNLKRHMKLHIKVKSELNLYFEFHIIIITELRKCLATKLRDLV